MSCQLLGAALRDCQHHFDVISYATNSREITEAVAQREPNIAVVSANLKDGPVASLRAVRDLRACHPEVRSIFLMEEEDPAVVVDAFRRGAKGVFLKTAPFDDLCKCIERVHQGQIWASSKDLQIVLEAFASAIPMRAVNYRGEALLTTRELEIVNLVCLGLTNKDISNRLSLSSHTVKNYLFRIFDKLGISTRVELVLYNRNGAVKDEHVSE